jgi:hypothetical protein
VSVRIIITIAAAMIVAVVILGSIGAQAPDTVTTQLRITARLLEEDNRVEFGLQQRWYGDEWARLGRWGISDKVLPARNKFPLDTDHDQWLNSASVELAPPGAGRYARIVARHTVNDAGNPRVEFGLQVRTGDEPYGEKIAENILLPEIRLFNYVGTKARTGDWLYSSTVRVPLFERVSEGTWPWTRWAESTADGDYVGYELRGKDKGAAWPFSTAAVMYIRCLNGEERGLLFGFDRRIWDDSTTVTYRVSGAESQTDTWYPGLNNYSLFAEIEPDGPFALYIDTHYAPGRKLYVDFSTRSYEYQLEFTLTGLHAVLSALPCW